MIENELYVGKDYKFDHPVITEVDSIIDKSFGDCHNNYFHNFKYECTYDIKLTNFTNNEINNLTISGKSMSLFELNKNSIVVRQNSFLFNQISKLTIEFYSHLRYIDIGNYLKSQIPM